MIQTLNAPLSVLLKYDHRARESKIVKILYDGREYPIVKIGLHYTERDGKVLRHIFCAAGESMFFKLALNTDTLQWTCEEIRNHAGHAVE